MMWRIKGLALSLTRRRPLQPQEELWCGLTSQMDVPFRYLSLTQSVQRDFLLLAMSQSCFTWELLCSSLPIFLFPIPLLSFLGFANSIPGWSLRWSILPLQRNLLSILSILWRTPLGISKAEDQQAAEKPLRASARNLVLISFSAPQGESVARVKMGEMRR